MDTSLSVTYQDLLVAVGHFLGFDAEPHKWSSGERDTVDRYVQTGYRNFLFPPAAPGIEPGHQWSFMQPATTITTTADQAVDDLPADFGRICGGLTFEPFEYTPVIAVVPIALVEMRQQTITAPGRPRAAAVRAKTFDAAVGQRWEILWWPTPDDAYTLSFRYEANAGKLSEASPYPLGGTKMAGLIEQSCLAVAESLGNDERGVQWESYIAMLASAIAQDKKSGARFFGSMGQPTEVDFVRQRHKYPYPLTYKGVDL